VKRFPANPGDDERAAHEASANWSDPPGSMLRSSLVGANAASARLSSTWFRDRKGSVPAREADDAHSGLLGSPDARETVFDNDGYRAAAPSGNWS
jgi:hypothetical protein